VIRKARAQEVSRKGRKGVPQSLKLDSSIPKPILLAAPDVPPSMDTESSDDSSLILGEQRGQMQISAQPPISLVVGSLDSFGSGPMPVSAGIRGILHYCKRIPTFVPSSVRRAFATSRVFKAGFAEAQAPNFGLSPRKVYHVKTTPFTNSISQRRIQSGSVEQSNY
jgi:hypothetical protein